jgi:hypothetical protein
MLAEYIANYTGAPEMNQRYRMEVRHGNLDLTSLNRHWWCCCSQRRAGRSQQVSFRAFSQGSRRGGTTPDETLS